MESFYAAVNERQLETALDMLDDEVVYEDFTFQDWRSSACEGSIAR